MVKQEERHQKLLQLQARYAKLNNQKIKGTISYEVYEQAYNRIIDSLLSLLGSLEIQQRKVAFVKPPKKSFPLYTVVAIIILVIGSFFVFKSVKTNSRTTPTSDTGTLVDTIITPSGVIETSPIPEEKKDSINKEDDGKGKELIGGDEDCTLIIKWGLPSLYEEVAFMPIEKASLKGDIGEVFEILDKQKSQNKVSTLYFYKIKHPKWGEGWVRRRDVEIKGGEQCL